MSLSLSIYLSLSEFQQEHSNKRIQEGFSKQTIDKSVDKIQENHKR